MSSRALVVCAVALLAACGPDASTKGSREPRNAKEKQRLEARTKGESPDNRKWGGWRYTGERDDCFFVVGRKCFKTEAAACQAAHCAAPKHCEVTGGGPATISCAKK
jgi:hypothetical protein